MFVFQARMFHKWLILLAVPLLFEFVVGATLIYLQRYYGEAVQAEAERKAIIYHTNQLWYDTMWIITNSASAAFLGHRPDSLARDNSAQEFELLRRMIAGEPQQAERLDNIMMCRDRITILCGMLRPYRSEGGSLGQILAMKSNLKTGRRIVEENVVVGGLIRSFREYELEQSAKAAASVRRIASLIQFVFIGAYVGSSVIAYLLFHYFMQGIHKSTQALLINIQLFRKKQPLAPALEGTDEIALLDQRFHEVAEEVGTAQTMKRAFLRTMSREIRAPIESATQYLKQLLDGSLGPISEEPKTLVEQAGKTLGRLIVLMNDLLSLEASGMIGIGVVPRKCGLAAVIQSAIEAIAPFASKNKIRVEAQETMLEVRADPDRITQVLVNFLSNAVKFSAPDSSVNVSALAVDGLVEVRVMDSGRGVPAHLRDAIFQRFEQVAATDATEKLGSGLGLPICKEIVELHGGTIGVESEPGKGSTFWFRLPGLVPDRGDEN